MSSESFRSELFSLSEIFEKNSFVIPDYQRAYAWDKQQVDDLLQDIEHLLQDERAVRHYTGTLVLARIGQQERKYDVVDGQQRLTTIVILISRLMNHLPDSLAFSAGERYVSRGSVGNREFILQLSSQSRTFFEDVIVGTHSLENNPQELESHQHLLTAKITIDEWLSKRLERSTDILSIIENDLGFLVYAPRNDAEIGIMFEVINNRGKALSQLELTKNYLIYCSAKLGADTLRNRINTVWSSILKNLSDARLKTNQEESAFLRYCSVVHLGLGKASSQNVYAELKKILTIESLLLDREKSINTINALVDFLKDASLWYARLYGRNHQGLAGPVIEVLDRLRAQAQHASVMPLILSLAIKFGGKGDDMVRLLNLVEILNFRVYMTIAMTPRNDTGQGALYRYAANFFEGKTINDVVDYSPIKITFPDLMSELEYWLVDFCVQFSPEINFVDSFDLKRNRYSDFYKWTGLRYFLMSYEAHLQPRKAIMIDKILLSRSEVKSNDYYSVEHLWATAHRNELNENDRASDLHERRRLGNFVLLELGINIEGSKNGIEDKIKRYLGREKDNEATDLSHVRKMAHDAKRVLENRAGDVRSKNYFRDRHADLNDLQEARYIKFAVARWSVKSFFGYQDVTRRAREDAIDENN